MSPAQLDALEHEAETPAGIIPTIDGPLLKRLMQERAFLLAALVERRRIDESIGADDDHATARLNMQSALAFARAEFKAGGK